MLTAKSFMMFSKKASLVTVSSLLNLCNGCCSRHVANCIKDCNTSRAIYTAAKRWGFRLSGGYQADDSSDYQQNRAGLYNRRASGSYRYKHASSNSSYKGTLVEVLDSFCRDGKVNESVDILQVLEKLYIHMDLQRCLQLMHVCGKTKSLEEARVVHRHALQHLHPLTVSTDNRVLEMYFECGSLDDAIDVFKSMPEYDLTTWQEWVSRRFN